MWAAHTFIHIRRRFAGESDNTGVDGCFTSFSSFSWIIPKDITGFFFHFDLESRRRERDMGDSISCPVAVLYTFFFFPKRICGHFTFHLSVRPSVHPSCGTFWVRGKSRKEALLFFLLLLLRCSSSFFSRLDSCMTVNPNFPVRSDGHCDRESPVGIISSPL